MFSGLQLGYLVHIKPLPVILNQKRDARIDDQRNIQFVRIGIFQRIRYSLLGDAVNRYLYIRRKRRRVALNR